MLNSDWQFLDNPLNVTGDADGLVTPRDALVIINEINDPQVSDFITGRLQDVSDSVKPPPFYDVDGDEFVSHESLDNTSRRQFYRHTRAQGDRFARHEG